MGHTALLCWEAGGGLGHVTILAIISQKLRARGWRCALALPAHAAAAASAASGDLPIYAAPRWGAGADALPRTTFSSASMGDTLAQIGLQSADWVRHQIAGWHALFAELAPKLVIADFAPGAVLAARSRIPCVAVGTGYSVPPPGLRPFPPRHDRSAVVYEEEALCATVNSVLVGMGTAPIDGLAETLRGDAACVCTFPILDPYGRWRRETVLGPVLRQAITIRDAGADEVFCYLSPAPRPHRVDYISGCLADLPARVIAFLPGVQAGRRAELRRRGVKVLERPATISEQLRCSRLVIHAGGHGLTAAAILAGVPQIALSYDIEKRQNATALAQRGIAHWYDYRHADVEAVRAGISSAFDDPVMAIEAQRAAVEHESFRDRDVASEIADVCERLLA